MSTATAEPGAAVLRDCPLCGADNRALEPTHVRGGWQVKRCACSMVYLENPPAYVEFEEDYAWDKTSVAEREARQSREPFVHAISDAIKSIRRNVLHRDKLGTLIRGYFRPGNVVDVGCADGNFLGMLDAQYIPFGIEISKMLAPIADDVARPRGGWVVQAAAVDGFAKFGGEKFMGVIMSSFLEHEIQPKLLLEQCAKHLEKNGRVIIKVPNYGCINRMVRGERWCGFRYPDHVNYFTPETLVYMCVDAGLEIVRYRWNDRQPFSDNMWLVAGKR